MQTREHRGELLQIVEGKIAEASQHINTEFANHGIDALNTRLVTTVDEACTACFPFRPLPEHNTQLSQLVAQRRALNTNLANNDDRASKLPIEVKRLTNYNDIEARRNWEASSPSARFI